MTTCCARRAKTLGREVVQPALRDRAIIPRLQGIRVARSTSAAWTLAIASSGARSCPRWHSVDPSTPTRRGLVEIGAVVLQEDAGRVRHVARRDEQPLPRARDGRLRLVEPPECASAATSDAWPDRLNG